MTWLTILTEKPAACSCWWITHPCDGKPMLMQPVPGCWYVAHVWAWRDYVWSQGVQR